MSGLEKGTVGFEPAGMEPAKLNFGDARAAPVDGSMPRRVATAGSMTPAGPVAAVVGAPQVPHAALLGVRKLLISVRPTTFWLPRTRFRKTVRWYPPKKNVLSWIIGPPKVPPN